MIIDLAGKRAVVTGSTAGIGHGIALGLARAGAAVVVTGRTRARVDAAMTNIRAQSGGGAEVNGVAADLGTPAGIETLVAQVPACDILVNNLGIFSMQPFAEVPDAEWQRFFDVNVMSGVRASRAYLSGMARRGWGRIVFISSESGLQVQGDIVHYSMTKTAQLAIARGLAESVPASGVTVNTVLPGPTFSELGETLLAEAARQQGKTLAQVESDFFQFVRPSSLLKRFATVEEVANMVVYLCSPQASATTGAALRVDGGVVRAIA
jgi:NAD(P)-dependent dehydrogenase (short-subunit alcohol dehydrogenase family)